MNTLKKAMIGTAAATAMAVSAAPAQARGYDNDGISAGEVIAGAVVLGGLAAILTSGKNDRYDNRGYDRGDYYRGNGNRYGNRQIAPRQAVNMCVRAAERQASYRGNADVTDVRDVERTRYGYKINGRIAVQDNYRGRNYRNNRGYNRGGYDTGKFTCYVEGRRVSDIKFKGI